MAKYCVEMFGLSKEITELRSVEIELGEGVSLRDLVAALRRKIPALEGKVIRSGQDRLTEQYVFNIDGRFYFDTDKVELREGATIRLVLLSTGG
jgi:molybdopterin converting factor small subunit